MKSIFNWFIKYFIPHERNNHKPHLLRWEAVLVFLGLIVFLEVIFLVQILVIFPKTGFFANILPDALVDLTNRNRTSNNFAPLKINPLLEKAAQLKAEDMVKMGYFAHNTPDGQTPWFWFERAGYKFSYAGENLAINFFDSEDLMNAWLKSPLHKENILSRNFTEIGIAAAKGVYNGREAVFVVQMFGRPAQTLPVLEEKPAVITKDKEPEKNQERDKKEIAIATEVEGVQYSSVAAKIISKPETNTRFLYFVLFTIVFVALMLKIFVKIKIQHPPLIVNGVLLLLVISSVLWLNQFIVTLVQAKIL